MTGIFLTKDVQWATATVDVVEYWNLVMKIFLGNGNGYGWWKKGNKKTCQTVRSPPCCPHVNKRQKEKNASLSRLHIKTSDKRYPEKIASLSHLHKKILFTKNNQKKLSHCPISTLRSPCSMLMPHAPTLLFSRFYLHASIVTCKKLELTATLVSPCFLSHVPVQMLPMASEKFAVTASGNSDGWRQLTMMTIEVDGWAIVLSQSWISIENSIWLSQFANF